MRIEPAVIELDESGTPYSPLYGDVYHSAESGPRQAQHVFLGGNDLPRRWAGARVFTILETGFGLGVNFLATWRARQADPARPERLHFVSVEKHPPGRALLERMHAVYPEFATLSRALRDAWPLLVPGLHRLHFDDEAVTLTLAFGDVEDVLPRLEVNADAIYLDGFAPRVNEAMWSPELMRKLARHAHTGTTLATWSTAAAVRGALEAAGFVLEKRPGFGAKREMLSGRYAPRWPVHSRTAGKPRATDRHAIVVGAGLAGAAVTEHLSARGWRIDLVDRRTGHTPPMDPRFGAVFHPHVSSDDAIRSRFARTGFLYGLARWRDLADSALEWSRCDVLQVADDAKEESRMAETMRALGFSREYAQYVDRSAGERLCGCALRHGGWWFPGAGWMRPASLIAAQLARASARSSLTEHYATGVHAIRREGGSWEALRDDGTVIASAPVLVLANSTEVTRLAPIGAALDRVRGQVTYVPAEAIRAPQTVLTGPGYVLPAADGMVVTGSTYDGGESDPQPHTRGHEANLMRLTRLLANVEVSMRPGELDGAVGFRCATPDRMPLIGAMPDVELAREEKERLRGGQPDVPRRPGLYCATGFASRGLIGATLAGEMIGSLLEGEPLPVEADLADAVDPARFVLRQARRGRL